MFVSCDSNEEVEAHIKSCAQDYVVVLRWDWHENSLATVSYIFSLHVMALPV